MKFTLKFLALIFSVLILTNIANAEAPSMQVATSPVFPGSPITGTQFRKVLNVLMKRGTDGSLKQKYAKALGLNKNGEAVWVRQLAIEDDNAVEYGFALLKEGSGYMLDKRTGPERRIAYHLDANLKVVAVYDQHSADEITILSPPADA